MFSKRSFHILFFLLILSACSNRPKEVLSMKEMTNILTDLHTLDGVFTTEGFRHIDMNEKSKYYSSVLAKHHTTQAQFDSSLVWYSRDPKRFEKIYVRVINKLTTHENDIKAGKYHEILPEGALPPLQTAELWLDAAAFTMSKDSLHNLLAFTIQDSALMPLDKYTLKLAKAASADSCTSRQVYLRIHYAGGHIDSIKQLLPDNDNPRTYTLRMESSGARKITSVTGIISGPDSCFEASGVFADHVSLIREYNPQLQDSLRIRVEHLESLRTFPYLLFQRPYEKPGFITYK